MFRHCAVFVVLSLFGLFVQGALIHSFFPSAIAPDIILILIVILARQSHTLPALLGAFFLGLLADLASGVLLGPNAAGAVVAFGLVGAIARRVYAERYIAVVILTFVCSAAKSLTAVLMVVLYVGKWTLPQDALRVVLIEAAASALLAPVVLKGMLWVSKVRAPRRLGGVNTLRWSQDLR